MVAKDQSPGLARAFLILRSAGQNADLIAVITPYRRNAEGFVSKHWIKVKNRKHHAFARVQEAHRL